MRIKLLILAILFLLFGARSAFAVSLNFSDVPQTINDQPFSFNVSISGAGAGTNYLKVDLYKEGTINYFGETYNGNDWYSGSAGKQYLPITIASGQTWNGSVQGRIGNPTLGEYPGPGNYKLRIRRYTSSGGTGTTDQTPQDIQIIFALSSPTPSPTTSPSSTSSPAPSSSSSTSSTSSFIISNIPSKIDSTETFNASVNLSLSSKPNTIFYLKGAFKKQGETNYFGLTKVGNSWIKNNTKYEDQYKITTNGNGIWSGNLEIQPDIFDSGYEGAGEYIFKIGRYSEDGALNWSNEVTITINAQEVVLEEDDSNVLGVTDKQSQKNQPKTLESEEYSLEKYIKVATPASKIPATPSAKVKGERQINFLAIIGSILVIIGAVPIIYAIYNKFRTRN